MLYWKYFYSNSIVILYMYMWWDFYDQLIHGYTFLNTSIWVWGLTFKLITAKFWYTVLPEGGSNSFKSQPTEEEEMSSGANFSVFYCSWERKWRWTEIQYSICKWTPGVRVLSIGSPFICCFYIVCSSQFLIS